MSGDENITGGSLTPDENKELFGAFIRLSGDEFKEWCGIPKNMTRMQRADSETKEAFEKKKEKFGVKLSVELKGIDGILESKKAPAVIDKLSSSERPKPKESGDVQYLSWAEKEAGGEFNTLSQRIVPDQDANPLTHAGPWIDFVKGRNEKSGHLMIEKLPGKWEDILPSEVLMYLGSVVEDHNSVHSAFVNYKKTRLGYVFDRFFAFNGKKYSRCCLVRDRIHQAGLIYEKYVPKNATKGDVRVKRLKGEGNANKMKYKLISGKEGDYRDLERLFIRHFLHKNDGLPQNDAALMSMLNETHPEVTTEV